MTANKKLTISALVMMAGIGLFSTAVSMMLPHLVRDFALVGAEQGYFGLFSSVFATVAILSVFLLQGRVQKFRMLIIGMLILAITSLLSGWAPSLGVLLLAYSINGIGVGYYEIYASAAILDLQPERSSVYMGMLHGCWGLGALIGPFLARFVLRYSTWHGVYYVFGGILLLLALQAILVSVAVRKNGAPVHPVPEPKLTREHWKKYAGDKMNWLWWLAVFLAVGGQYSFVYYIVSYIETTLGQPDIAALSLIMFWVTCTAGRFAYPRIKARPMQVLLVSSALCGLIIAGAMLWANGVMMLVACAAIGFTTAPGIPMIYNEGGRRYPQMSAVPVAVMSVMSFVARALMPPAIGAVSRTAGLQLAMLMPAALYLFCAALCAVLLRVSKPGCEERPQEV